MKTSPNPPPKSEKFYFEKEFVWNMKSAEIFYRFTIRSFFKSYYHQFYKRKEDYEDVFQYSISKFCEKVEGGIYQFDKNSKAYSALRTIFYNDSIDFVENGNKIIYSYEEYDLNMLDQEDPLNPVYKSESQGIEQIFSTIDKKLSHDPKIMSKKVTEFYQFFKKAILVYPDNKMIRNYVMNQMKIDEGYYSRLKTSLIKIIQKNK